MSKITSHPFVAVAESNRCSSCNYLRHHPVHQDWKKEALPGDAIREKLGWLDERDRLNNLSRSLRND